MASVSAARAQSGDPSILVQSRFNKEWSPVFLNHLRSVIIQNDIPDPYQRTFEKPLVFDLGSQVKGLSEDGENWFRLFQQFLKIDLLRSEFKLVIEGLNYKVGNLDADITPANAYGGMLWKMEHNVSDLGLGAQRMALQVSLHSVSGQPIVFSIDLMDMMLDLEGLTVPARAVWSSSIFEDKLGVSLEQVDLREALQKMHAEDQSVRLSVRDVEVPPVEIRIGSRRVRIEPTKVRSWILANQAQMKKFILDVIVLKNLDAFEDITGDEDLLVRLNRHFYAPSEFLSAAISLNDITTQEGQVQSRLDGVFCVPREATDLKSCQASAPRNPRVDRVGINYQASVSKIFEDLEQKNANIIVSLSEAYLNQAAAAAIEAGLLNDAFDDEISLASGGVMIQLDRKGDVFHGYLHLTNRMTDWYRRFTGRSVITFPIRLGVKLKLEQVEGVPTLMIDIVEAEAPTQLLLSGAPEMGMPTTINTVPRFRNRVVEKVQVAVKKFQGLRLAAVPMPFLKGTFFERTQFMSDGFGRANALFKVDEKRGFK